jgi:hypothetical protein
VSRSKVSCCTSIHRCGERDLCERGNSHGSFQARSGCGVSVDACLPPFADIAQVDTLYAAAGSGLPARLKVGGDHHSDATYERRGNDAQGADNCNDNGVREKAGDGTQGGWAPFSSLRLVTLRSAARFFHRGRGGHSPLIVAGRE